MSSLFIDRIKTLKINDLNRKVTHKNDFKQSKKLMAWNKISKVTSKKTLTRLFNHSSLCQVIQKGNFMFVMVSFFGNASKASFQLECCLEFHQITALFLPFYLSIYLSIYLFIYIFYFIFYYWQTYGKGLFRNFRFLKLVKKEHELLQECFEEPKPVSVKNINR